MVISSFYDTFLGIFQVDTGINTHFIDKTISFFKFQGFFLFSVDLANFYFLLLSKFFDSFFFQILKILL
jgi:hypothetical protein